MKRILLALALAASAAPALAQVGVSLNIGEPGFFGQVDIGQAPPPQVIYSQPTIVEQGAPPGLPIYLHVPAGYAKHWRDHCREYDACGRRVYFVRDDWYQKVYVPHYHQNHEFYEQQRHGIEEHEHAHDWHHEEGHHDEGHRDNDHR